MTNLSDRLFDVLRQDIVHGRYRPHQRLVESDLAQEYDASRTPIRQALQRLELDGLVSSSRHGWVIREHSGEELLAMYDIRIAIEGYASRLAAERGSDSDMQELKATHESLARYEGILMGVSDDDDERSRFVDLHDEFHDKIVKTAANPVLRDAIGKYRAHPFNRRVAHNYTPAELERAAKSHRAILDAIWARNATEAELLTREHLVLSRDVTLDRVKRGM